MSQLSKEYVRWAYRLFLDREPESEAVLNHEFASTAEIRSAFLESPEFKSHNTTSFPPAIRPQNYQPQLPLLNGYSEERIKDWLASLTIDGLGGDELHGYLQEALRRIIYIVDLVPQTATQGLEIGANPYFMTATLRNFRNCRLTLTNFFGDPVEPGDLPPVIVPPQELVLGCSFPLPEPSKVPRPVALGACTPGRCEA